MTKRFEFGDCGVTCPLFDRSIIVLPFLNPNIGTNIQAPAIYMYRVYTGSSVLSHLRIKLLLATRLLASVPCEYDNISYNNS